MVKGKGLPPEWRQAFLNTANKVQDDAVNFLSTSLNPKSILEITITKFWYTTFLRQITKRPTSELQWQKHTLWHNINPIVSNPICVNTDYKIRHRRIFTCVILHQINKNVYGRGKKIVSTSFSSVLSVSASQSR